MQIKPEKVDGNVGGMWKSQINEKTGEIEWIPLNNGAKQKCKSKGITKIVTMGNEKVKASLQTMNNPIEQNVGGKNA